MNIYADKVGRMNSISVKLFNIGHQYIKKIPQTDTSHMVYVISLKEIQRLANRNLFIPTRHD